MHHGRSLLAALLLGCLMACGEDQEPERARQVWDRIAAEGYRSWVRAPGYEEPTPSRAAHEQEVIIYINDVVVADLAASPAVRSWSEGAVIVKEGFDDGDLCLVAVMEKTGGEWFWAEYDADGDALFSGTPDLCVGCHTIGDDFVRGFFFPVDG